jgi:hypothetical protein
VLVMAWDVAGHTLTLVLRRFFGCTKNQATQATKRQRDLTAARSPQNAEIANQIASHHFLSTSSRENDQKQVLK